MRHLFRHNYASKNKQTITLILIPFIFAAAISSQVLLKPVNFLFADDWLLLEYLTSEKKISLTELFQLVNGHNVLTTKLILLVLSNLFGANTLVAFTIFNILLAAVACFLIIKKLSNSTPHPYIVTIMGTILFFNYKQAQNYNMIISAHFVHSLICFALYLYIIDSPQRKLRWIPLIIAPFTGGFGITILILEVFLSIKEYLSSKIKSNLRNIFVCASIFMLAYGFNLISRNTINNTADYSYSPNSFSGFLHPWYLPSFFLSTIGSQFIPSSNFMGITSQIAGLIMIILIYKLRNEIREKIYLTAALFVSVITVLLITVNAYDGTYDSLKHAYSNRYVSCTVLIPIVALAVLTQHTNLSFRKFIIMALVISSCFSGLKSGFEWVNIRNSQSVTLEKLCYSKSQSDNKKCIEMSYSQSFYKDQQIFEKRLGEFTDFNRNK
jgi:hypothetical protein